LRREKRKTLKLAKKKPSGKEGGGAKPKVREKPTSMQRREALIRGKRKKKKVRLSKKKFQTTKSLEKEKAPIVWNGGTSAQ